jgi:glycosyltransferase involved in cell wall biosynthesis
VLFEQTVLAWKARRFDVVYVPGNLGLMLAAAPQVVCQQNAWYYTDAVREFRRRACPPRMRVRLAVEVAIARASVTRARTAVTVSQTMREMLEADLGPLGHVRVIPSAAPDLNPNGAARGDLSTYVLAVAPDDPHKDLDGIVEAFARHRDLPQLVVAGRCTATRSRDLEARAPGRVRLLGQIHDRQAIADLYGSAKCVLAHSYFESFGLTPAEALRCGAPVAATDIPAHREVCGELAHYYTPGDVDGLAAAVRKACATPLRLRSSSPRTWDENAAELAIELRTVAGTRHLSRRLDSRARLQRRHRR